MSFEKRMPVQSNAAAWLLFNSDKTWFINGERSIIQDGSIEIAKCIRVKESPVSGKGITSRSGDSENYIRSSGSSTLLYVYMFVNFCALKNRSSFRGFFRAFNFRADFVYLILSVHSTRSNSHISSSMMFFYKRTNGLFYTVNCMEALTRNNHE